MSNHTGSAVQEWNIVAKEQVLFCGRDGNIAVCQTFSQPSQTLSLKEANGIQHGGLQVTGKKKVGSKSQFEFVHCRNKIKCHRPQRKSATP